MSLAYYQRAFLQTFRSFSKNSTSRTIDFRNMGYNPAQLILTRRSEYMVKNNFLCDNLNKIKTPFLFWKILRLDKIFKLERYVKHLFYIIGENTYITLYIPYNNHIINIVGKITYINKCTSFFIYKLYIKMYYIWNILDFSNTVC